MGKKKEVEMPKDVKKISEQNREAELEKKIADIIQQYLMIQQEELNGALNQMSNRILTSETVLKRKLGVSNQYMSSILSDIEDTQAKIMKVKDGAVVGDTIRVSVVIKAIDDKNYPTQVQNLKFMNIGTEGCQLFPAIRSGIMGMKEGEGREITFENQKKFYVARVVMGRVSRPISKIVPKESLLKKIAKLFSKKEVVKVAEKVAEPSKVEPPKENENAGEVH